MTKTNHCKCDKEIGYRAKFCRDCYDAKRLAEAPRCPDCNIRVAHKDSRCDKCANKFYKGKNHPSWKGGLPKCLDCDKKVTRKEYIRCEDCYGKYIREHPEEHSQYIDGQCRHIINYYCIAGCGAKVSSGKNKCSSCAKIGELNHKYIDGRTSLIQAIRTLDEYKSWIRTVFIRDNYTCQDCFHRGGRLNVHHLKSLIKIFEEFLQKYNMFSPIEDRETLRKLATIYEPFWDITNGETLCKSCHDKITYKKVKV